MDMKVAQAYVDEAGEKGFLRNLSPDKDAAIALLAALVIPQLDSERFITAFTMPFEAFKAARPPGVGSLHITDAFTAGNEEWASVARRVRSDIFNLIETLQIPLVYDARRLQVARRSFEFAETLKNQSRSMRRSDIKISNRPSGERLEETCMIGLLLKLDALAENCAIEKVDLFTDYMDSSITQSFESTMERARSIGNAKERVVKGWDPKTRTKVQGTIQLSVSAKDFVDDAEETLHAQHIGDLVVVGKDNPMVFAADVVVNGLYHHLRSLAVDAPLNHPSSIEGWFLKSRVLGVRDNAFEDHI